MPKCAKCGADNPENRRWCVHCMKPLQEALEQPRRENPELPESKLQQNPPSRLRGTMGTRLSVAADMPEEKKEVPAMLLAREISGTEPKQPETRSRLRGTMGTRLSVAADMPEEKNKVTATPPERESSGTAPKPVQAENPGKTSARNAAEKRLPRPAAERETLAEKKSRAASGATRTGKPVQAGIRLRIIAAVAAMLVVLVGGMMFFGKASSENQSVQDHNGSYESDVGHGNDSFGESLVSPPADDQGQSYAVVRSASEATAFLKQHGKEYGYDNALSDLMVENTVGVDGDSYYRLQQTYKGIPVYGRYVVCNTDAEGNITALVGNVTDITVSVSLTPTVSKTDVEASVAAYCSDVLGIDCTGLGNAVNLSRDDLFLYNLDNAQQVHLVYRVGYGAYEFIVDAASGDVLSALSLVQDLAVEGYRASDKDKKSPFVVEKYSNGEYVLEDTRNNIEVRDFMGQISKEVDQYGNTVSHLDRAVRIVSDDNIFGNGSKESGYEDAVDLYLNFLRMRDFFRLEIPVSGPDENRKVVLYYNDGYYNGRNAQGGRFWTTDEAQYENIIIMGSVTGVNDIDVMAHEYTHFVSREAVHWGEISIENEALNEAYSDIFGELIEAWYNGWESPDWEMRGDQVQVRRSLKDPATVDYADHVQDSYQEYAKKRNKKSATSEDYFYSTVVSHAAYLMWNGIDGNSDWKIGTQDLAELWYRSMLLLPPDCDFDDCRHMVILAAKSMELTQEQIRCVAAAFDKVGITGVSPEKVKTEYTLAQNGKLRVYGGDGELYDNYILEITGERISRGLILEKQDAPYSCAKVVTKAEAYQLSLSPGVYHFVIRNQENPAESVAFTVDVPDKGGPEELNIFTSFGSTPVKGTVSTIQIKNGVKTNVPLSHAVVRVYSEPGRKLVETISMDSTEGFFMIYLPEGTYTLVAEAEGYVSATTAFQVTSGEDVNLTVELSPLKDNLLTQVNVYTDGGADRTYYLHYDENRRLISVEFAEGGSIDTTLTYTYDSQGRLTGVDCGDYWLYFANEKYFYNSSGRLARRENLWGGEEPYWYREYEYDSAGNLSRIWESYGDEVYSVGRYSYVYDDQGRILERHIHEDGSDEVGVEYRRYDSAGRLEMECVTYIPKDQYNTQGNPGVEWDDRDANYYYYDYAPFLLVWYGDCSNVTARDAAAASATPFREVHGNVIEFRDSAGNLVWSQGLGSGTLAMDEYGYVVGATDRDNGCRYELIYGREREQTEDAQNPWDLYAPVVERIQKEAVDCVGEELAENCAFGILYDLDRDGVEEMVLCYPHPTEQPWLWYYAYGVYDVEQRKLVTVAEDVTFGGTSAAAGSAGYAGVAEYNGEPVLITCAQEGETSIGQGCRYPKARCTVNVYAYDSLNLIRTLEVHTNYQKILYFLDGEQISEQTFGTEMERFKYLEFHMAQNVWIHMENTISKMSMPALLAYLEGERS